MSRTESFLLLFLPASFLAIIVYKLSAILLVADLFLLSKHWELLEAFVLYVMVVGVARSYKQMKSIFSTRSFLAALNEKFVATRIILSFPQNIKNAYYPGWESWRLRLITRPLKRKLLVLTQDTFNSGHYLPSLVCLPGDAVNYIFTPQHPLKLLTSKNEKFKLFHEIGHCHKMNISVFHRHLEEVGYLVFPLLLYIWSVSQGIEFWRASIGAVTLIALYGLALTLRAADRLKAEIHADNVGLRYTLATSDYSPDEVAALADLDLPKDIELTTQQQETRQSVLSSGLKFLNERGILPDQTALAEVPVAYALIHSVLIGLLCWSCIWGRNISDFPWEIAWWATAGTVIVSVPAGILTISTFQKIQSVAYKREILTITGNEIKLEEGAKPLIEILKDTFSGTAKEIRD